MKALNDIKNDCGQETGKEYSTTVWMILKDDRGKAIAWRSVSCKMTSYRVSDEKNSINSLSAFCTQSAVCILYLVCILYPVCSLQFTEWTMVTLNQVKTNANARLANVAVHDAILRGHSVC